MKISISMDSRCVSGVCQVAGMLWKEWDSSHQPDRVSIPGRRNIQLIRINTVTWSWMVRQESFLDKNKPLCPL